jgi:endonuclease YncB( thermonuclease family)
MGRGVRYRARVGAITLVVAAMALVSGCRLGTVTYVVDGDTLDVDGRRIRIQGIDTPERGKCGFQDAKERLSQLVGGRRVIVKNGGGDTVDQYDREIAYIQWDGLDLGTVLIGEGRAKARYDGLDGYDRHELQDRYRSLDQRVPDRCK